MTIVVPGTLERHSAPSSTLPVHGFLTEKADCESPARPSASLGAHDLAEIMSAFTTVTDRLQGAHQALQEEVKRLNHELHETNEQLRRSRQLAALGQMAAGIAHEVRNPLGSIRLYASMLAQDLSDRPESCRLASQITRAVADLDAIVGDVLTFAREMSVRPRPVRVADLFDQALESCCCLLHGAPIDVRRDAAVEEALAPLLADGALVSAALANLVRNAVEAMPGGGTLSLSACVDHGRNADSPPSMRLTVDDTGPGIPEEIVERIFNPFFTTRPTGTGLGLAIVHRIVDAHGGEIDIGRSAAGGASITLIFPLHPKSTSACLEPGAKRPAPGAPEPSPCASSQGVHRACSRS